jgi:hypothetical protein
MRMFPLTLKQMIGDFEPFSVFRRGGGSAFIRQVAVEFRLKPNLNTGRMNFCKAITCPKIS